MLRTHPNQNLRALISEVPSTQYLSSLVPNTIKGMVFGTRDLNIGYLDSLGMISAQKREYRTAWECRRQV